VVNQHDQNREMFARYMYEVIDIVRATTRERGSMSIAEVAQLAEARGLDPADVLHVFESTPDCRTDWASQSIVCL
jgi:hypothetical protein